MAQTMIKMLFTMSILIFMLISQHCCDSATIDGIWASGPLNCSSGLPLYITVTVDSKDLIYKFDYGENQNPYYCGGYWVPYSETVFKEVFNYGDCVGDSAVLTPQTDSTILFSDWNVDALCCSGLLTRRANLCL